MARTSRLSGGRRPHAIGTDCPWFRVLACRGTGGIPNSLGGSVPPRQHSLSWLFDPASRHGDRPCTCCSWPSMPTCFWCFVRIVDVRWRRRIRVLVFLLMPFGSVAFRFVGPPVGPPLHRERFWSRVKCARRGRSDSLPAPAASRLQERGRAKPSERLAPFFDLCAACTESRSTFWWLEAHDDALVPGGPTRGSVGL